MQEYLLLTYNMAKKKKQTKCPVIWIRRKNQSILPLVGNAMKRN